MLCSLPFWSRSTPWTAKLPGTAYARAPTSERLRRAIAIIEFRVVISNPCSVGASVEVTERHLFTADVDRADDGRAADAQVELLAVFGDRAAPRAQPHRRRRRRLRHRHVGVLAA